MLKRLRGSWRIKVIVGLLLVFVLVSLLTWATSVEDVFGDMAHWPLRAGVWGTLGQWVAAMVAAVSAVISALSVLVALSILRRDREKDEWDNAYLVQLEVFVEQVLGTSVEGGKQLEVRYTFKCINKSARQISDVKFGVHTYGGVSLVALGIKPANQDGAQIEVVPAFGEKKYVAKKAISSKITRTVSPERMLRYEMIYTDTRGNTWLHDHKTGVVKRLTNKVGVRRLLTESIFGA